MTIVSNAGSPNCNPCGWNGLRTVLCTALALLAFAANSIFCRMALSDGAIDPASFSVIRLTSGALALLVIVAVRKVPTELRHTGTWTSAFLLFLYAVAFSFAYLSLSAGSGALILFGAVQVTMITAGLFSGERPRLLEWGGLLVAVGGLVYLTMPGLKAPSLKGAFLMALAGFAWGVYSLRGRNTQHPIAVTSDNFLRSVPFVAIVSLTMLSWSRISRQGVFLAVLSGALTSGLGYVVWYAALQRLSATRAATVQLLVPIIAAAGGVIFLAETVSLRLVISAVLILGGVGTTLVAKKRPKSKSLATQENDGGACLIPPDSFWSCARLIFTSKTKEKLLW